MADIIDITKKVKKTARIPRVAGPYSNNVVAPSFENRADIINRYNRASKVIADRATAKSNADIIDMLSKKPGGANNTFKELGEAVKKTNPKVDLAAQTTARVGKVKPGPMFGARAAVGPMAIYQGIQDYRDARNAEDDFHRRLNNISGASNVLGGTAATLGTTGSLIGFAGGTAPAWMVGAGAAAPWLLAPAVGIGAYKAFEPAGNWIAENWKDNPMAKLGAFIGKNSSTKKALEDKAFGGYSLTQLGFDKLPQSEYEMNLLRQRIIQVKQAEEAFKKQQEQAKKNILADMGNANGRVDSLGLYSASPDGVEKIINNARNNGQGYYNEAVTADNLQQGQQPTGQEMQGEMPEALQGLAMSGDISQIPQANAANGVDIMALLNQFNQQGNSNITPENLALARLAGGYRRNPYYAQLMDKTSDNRNLATAQAKIATEYMKQQQAEDTAIGTAYWLYNNRMANSLEDAYLMAKANPKLVNPYLGYIGRGETNQNKWNIANLQQYGQNQRTLWNIASREAIESKRNEFKLNPNVRTANEYIKAAFQSGSPGMVKQAESMVKLMIPGYFAAIGGPDENGPSADMYKE